MSDLIKAIRYNNIEEVKRLIEAGVDLNAQDESGYTALHVASCRRSKEIAQMLIEAGVDVNARDRWGGDTPLMNVSKNGCKELVEILTKAGADPNIRNKRDYTALTWACWRGNEEITKILIKAGAN